MRVSFSEVGEAPAEAETYLSLGSEALAVGTLLADALGGHPAVSLYGTLLGFHFAHPFEGSFFGAVGSVFAHRLGSRFGAARWPF